MKNKVGLGTFPLASVFSEVTKRDAEKIVRAFIDDGGYYIDTAPLYGFGEVEVLLGNVLKDYSHKDYFMITKCGYVDVEGKTFQTVQKSGKYDDVIRECEKSLKRLKIDTVDLYFVHSPDPNTPFEETMKALVKLQKDGKIKAIGVSNVNLEELKEYNRYGKIEYIQNRFSLINQSIDDEFKKYLIENEIKQIPYQPIERSQLSDRALGDFELRNGDLRIGRPDWEPLPLKTVTAWVKERLYPISKQLNILVEQLVIAWELEQPFVGFVIVGATNINQVKNNLKANKVKLSSGALKQLNKAYQELTEKIKSKYGQTIREFRGLNDKYY